MKKLLVSTIVLGGTILALSAKTFAHVVVTPSQAEVGARTMFNVSVPNEKNVAVTKVKLLIPKGIQSLQPNALVGWKISTTKDAKDNITSITWAGRIPVGQRADFGFKAQAPASSGSLTWKAYQTYADGSVVDWDQSPTDSGNTTKNDTGPYSVTEVVDNLAASSADAGASSNTNTTRLTLVFSVAALILSLGSLLLRHKR